MQLWFIFCMYFHYRYTNTFIETFIKICLWTIYSSIFTENIYSNIFYKKERSYLLYNSVPYLFSWIMIKTGMRLKQIYPVTEMLSLPIQNEIFIKCHGLKYLRNHLFTSLPHFILGKGSNITCPSNVYMVPLYAQQDGRVWQKDSTGSIERPPVQILTLTFTSFALLSNILKFYTLLFSLRKTKLTKMPISYDCCGN